MNLVERQALEESWRVRWAAFVPAPVAVLALQLEQPESLQWLTPVQRLILDSLGSPQRQAEWLRARAAENRLSQTARSEPLLTSVSHTGQTAAIAIGCKAGGRVQRVGVDLEPASRQVSERVSDRIATMAEKCRLSEGRLSALDLWVLKEAAFKAIPDNQGIVVSEIELEDWENEAAEGWMRNSRLESLGLLCRVKLLTGTPSAGWKVAFAYSVKSLE